MSETQTPEGTGTGPEGSAAAPVDTAPPADNAGQQPPTPDEGLTGVEAAAARASSRISKEKEKKAADSPPASNDSPPPDEQAADDTGKSTPSGEDDPQANDADDTAGAKAGKDDTPSDSTVAAPEDWPDDQKVRLAALPDDNARTLVLDFHKDMARGLTQAHTQLAEDRDNFMTAKTDLMDLDTRFNKGPDSARGVITELAKRAEIDVFFEAPLPEGELPDFKDTKELVAYIEKRTLAASDRANATRQSEAKSEADTANAATQLTSELDNARRDHTDYPDHKDTIMGLLTETPSMLVEHAYQLATYDGLKKLAQEGETAKQALTKATAELDKLRAAATQPPSGGDGDAPPVMDPTLTRGQRALERAKARKAKDQAAA